MNLFFISDLHITDSEDPLYHSLLVLIRQKAQKGDVLVFAGDLFDLFVGNKSIFTRRYHEFLASLKDAGSRGVVMHYIEGNHDFLIQKTFSLIPGMTVHPHDVDIEVSGKRFFVAHGDTVDRSDIPYIVSRLFFRSFVMKLLIFLIPGRWLDQIGQLSSQQSRKLKPILPTRLPAARMKYLRTIYRNYAAERLTEGYDYVVLGHCHDLDEMCFSVGGRSGQYVNIGFPRIHGSLLTWSPGDKKIQRERLPV